MTFQGREPIVELPEKSHVPEHAVTSPFFFISRYQRIYNLFTTSTCVWQYAFIPCEPHSTPIPLSLAPPNGSVGDRSRCVLTHTFPASSCRAILSAVSIFEDHTDAPRPIFVLLARAITSSSVFQERMGTIGPVVTKSLLTNCDILGGAWIVLTTGKPTHQMVLQPQSLNHRVDYR